MKMERDLFRKHQLTSLNEVWNFIILLCSQNMDNAYAHLFSYFYTHTFFRYSILNFAFFFVYKINPFLKEQ